MLFCADQYATPTFFKKINWTLYILYFKYMVISFSARLRKNASDFAHET